MTRFPPVADLVPHGPPMRAVEELLEWQPGKATAGMRVQSDGPFVRDGRVDAVLTLEYMAQTVAACLGQEAYTSGEGVRVGMVIACRSLVLERPYLEVGEELVIRVERISGSDAVSLFECETAVGDRAVARARLTLVHGEKPPDR